MYIDNWWTFGVNPVQDGCHSNSTFANRKITTCPFKNTQGLTQMCNLSPRWRAEVRDSSASRSANVCHLCFIDGLCQMPSWQSSLGWRELSGWRQEKAELASCLISACTRPTAAPGGWCLWQGSAEGPVCVRQTCRAGPRRRDGACAHVIARVNGCHRAGPPPASCRYSEHNWQADSHLAFATHTCSNIYPCAALSAPSAVLCYRDGAQWRLQRPWED